MSLFTKKFFYGIALTIAAIAFWGCSQPVDPPADITWTAEADGVSGTTTSTKITFTFAGAVTDLTAEQITLTNVTGTATKGAISGDGANWSLGITVETAGDITVAIDKAGVESGAKTITVHKQTAAPAPVTYTATADGASGATTSTKIDFVFNAVIEGLTAEQITLTNGTGTATKGALTGSGANWSLALTVDGAGDLTVAINKTGIENGAKTVTVHKQGEAAPDPVAYTVTADGASGVTTSTKIEFAFNEAVEGLTAEQITLTNGTGTVTKGDLTGNDTSWSLEITVETAGDITVAINQPGIENTEKDVTVHKALPALTDAIIPGWGAIGDGWATGSISGEGPEQAITLSVVEEPLAYFGIRKTAEQTITVGGADEAKVTRLEDGVSHGDKTASDTDALFSVNMEDLLFDGAFGESSSDAIPTGVETRAFTLTVSEDGKAPREIVVSLNIMLDGDTETSIYHREGTPGNYYYTKVRDAELPNTDIVSANFVAFDEGPVTDLQNAFVWVDRYGEGGDSNEGYADGTTKGYSEYRLFLKQSQKIGKMGFVIVNDLLNNDERDNISIELYGTGSPGTKELKITRDEAYSADVTKQMLNYGAAPNYGFITMGVRNGTVGGKYKALVLGKNITIDAEGSHEVIANQFRYSGQKIGWYALGVRYLVELGINSLFIMNDYSKLTGCYDAITDSASCAVLVPNSPVNGKFMMNGGAITGNVVGEYVVYGLKMYIYGTGTSIEGNVNAVGAVITEVGR